MTVLPAARARRAVPLEVPDALRVARPVLLLLLLVVTSWVAFGAVGSASLAAPAWPASGLLAGLLVTTPRRTTVLGVAGAGLLLVHLGHAVPLGVALGLSASTLLEGLVVARMLTAHRPGRLPELLDNGDVSRLVGAAAVGSAVAATTHALVALAAGLGDPLLGALAVLGTHAASLLILLPLFLRTPSFPAHASLQERAVQSALGVSTTLVVFLATDAPPAIFAVMPMFAWLGFRGTLREASLVLSALAVIATVVTVDGVGPVWALEQRYDLPVELVSGYLQLFLIDCGLILLPLSVSVAQERSASARAAAGRETLERIVASATSTAIMATDATGRLILFNPGAEQMLGCPAQDALGGLPDRFHPVEELERIGAELGVAASYAEIAPALVASGSPGRLWRFVRADRADQAVRTMSMTVSPVPDAGGALTGYLLTAEDVTEREETQAALLASLEHQAVSVRRLRELDQVKSDFVATVSHELRTPLTTIISCVELLEDGAGGALSPGQHTFVQRVDRNSRRLLTLIQDLLTLSQVEAAALRMLPTSCDLRAVVLAAREALGPALARRELDVSTEVPAGRVPFHGDPEQLERMLLNLLSNAVKFTPDGGSVRLVLAVGADATTIEVHDTGIGIAPEEQEQLFTRFFRSARATELAIQGTGLGLSITQAIVDLHGGTVELTSVPDEGTVARVVLPHAPQPHAP